MNKELEHIYSLTEDTQEDAKMWAFAIADVLWHHAAGVPMHWDFCHSSTCTGPDDDWPDSELEDLLLSGRISTTDLIALGNQVIAKGWPS